MRKSRRRRKGRWLEGSRGGCSGIHRCWYDASGMATRQTSDVEERKSRVPLLVLLYLTRSRSNRGRSANKRTQTLSRHTKHLSSAIHCQ